MAQPMMPAPMMTTSAVDFTRVAPSSLPVAIHAQLQLPMAESIAYRLPERPSPPPSPCAQGEGEPYRVGATSTRLTEVQGD